MWPLFRACKSGFVWELSFCAYCLRQSLGFPFQPMQPLKFLLCPTIEGLVKHEWHRRGAAASFSYNEASWAPDSLSGACAVTGMTQSPGRLPVGYVSLLSFTETSAAVSHFQKQSCFSNTVMVFGGKNSVLTANLLVWCTDQQPGGVGRPSPSPYPQHRARSLREVIVKYLINEPWTFKYVRVAFFPPFIYFLESAWESL